MPIDFYTGDRFSGDATRELRSREEGIQAGWLGLDCGPLT